MIDTIFPLRDCELLRKLNDAELSSIAIICTKTRMAEGDPLFQEGQAADHIYIVTNGRIALQKSLGDHRKKTQRGEATIAFCRPDEVVGWSALVEPYRYTLSATAWEPTQLLSIKASLLRRAMELNPDVGFRIMRSLSEVMARRLQQVARALTAARESAAIERMQ